MIESRGLTATRMIMSMSLIPPTAVSDGFMNMHIGVGVVGQDAFAAAAVPDADVAADRPPRGWLYRDQRVVAGAAGMSSHAPVHVMADVRGSRRVDDGELILIMDSVAIDGTAFAVRAVGLVRVVFLLP